MIPSSRKLSNSNSAGLGTAFKPLKRILLSLQLSLRWPLQLLVVLLLISFLLYSQLPTYLFESTQFHPAFWSRARNHPPSSLTLQTFLRKYDPAWSLLNRVPPSPPQDDHVKIAYFVQVAKDSVSLLERLFSRIHHPSNVYIVHVDAKVEPNLRDGVANLIHSSEAYSKNMYMMDSEMVTYRGISMVLNTISAMTLALEKHPTWHYFINLSGADYPLLSVVNQSRLLARPQASPGRLNFVSFFREKEWLPYSFRIRNMHWDPAVARPQNPKSHVFSLRGQTQNPMEKYRAFTFTKAEAWVILSRPFVRFIIRSAFAKRMLVNHMHVLSSPEHYFADVLYNHPLWRTTIVPNAYRGVVWYLRGHRSGQHPYILDGGARADIIWKAIESMNCLFARKFSKPDSPVMDRIDAELSGIGFNSEAFTKYQEKRQNFYEKIVKDFDRQTKTTLQQQTYT